MFRVDEQLWETLKKAVEYLGVVSKVRVLMQYEICL